MNIDLCACGKNYQLVAQTMGSRNIDRLHGLAPHDTMSIATCVPAAKTINPVIQIVCCLELTEKDSNANKV
jgi:hypothetical protein